MVIFSLIKVNYEKNKAALYKGSVNTTVIASSSYLILFLKTNQGY